METPVVPSYFYTAQPANAQPALKKAKRTMKRTNRSSDESLPVKKTLFEEKTDILEHIGRFYWFSTSQFRGAPYYHIRKYDQRGGKTIPTKTGIHLIPAQLKQLIDCAGTIEESADKAIQQNPDTSEYSVHLGFGTYLTVKIINNFKWFDIRRFFKPDGCTDPVHTRKGAMLRSEEFNRIVELIPRILEHSPELKNIQPCDCLFGNQLGYICCKQCNPFYATDF